MIAPATSHRRRLSSPSTGSDSTNPATMTPDDRLAEAATILAAGVLRLRRQGAVSVPAGPSDSSPESVPNGLDDCAGKRLHEHRG